ncbi:hypothetical protein ACFCT7_13390 [Fulvivirgaceae bacterium LMO-SS25]
MLKLVVLKDIIFSVKLSKPKYKPHFFINNYLQSAWQAFGYPNCPSRSNPTFITYEQFQLLINEIRAWPRTLKVTNNLQDTKRGIEILNDIQREVDV